MRSVPQGRSKVTRLKIFSRLRALVDSNLEGGNPTKMRHQFDFVTVPTSDTPNRPTIVLSYDDKKYLFNCGEGVQRQMISRKIPMRKIKEVFTTYGWDSHGGLAGLLLSQTSQQENLDIGIHGPKNIAYFLATLRAGQQRGLRYTDKISLRIREFAEALPEPFTDRNVLVQPIVTLPTTWQQPESRPHTNISSSHASAADLEDPSRVLNIAKSVWSGQFLERQKDGSWSTSLVSQESPKSDEECVNSTKRSRSSGSPQSPRPMKRVQKRADTPVGIKPDFQPSLAKARAFNAYMSSDLPGGFSPFPASVSYFIQGQPLPGKFDPERAKALGVVPGPLFGRLQKGYAVKIPSGKTIYSHEVMGPKRIVPAVLIIDCPSTEYIENLLRKDFWTSCVGERQISVIVHSCGDGVLEDGQYQRFMSSFGSSVTHLISREDYTADKITIWKSAEQLSLLRELDSEMYPTLNSVDAPKCSSFDTFDAQAINSSAVEANLQFNPAPYLSITRAEEIRRSVLSGDHQEALDQFHQSCEQVSLEVKALIPSKAGSFPGSEVEVNTLGTGSAGPSSYRNVASTLIRANENLSILLDCGEGTVGQLKRAFGLDYTRVLSSIRLIFISHMHADHHLGLIGLIREWTRQKKHNDDKLCIICPQRYSRSIIEYDNVEPINVSRVIFVESAQLSLEVSDRPVTGADHHSEQINQMKKAIPEVRHIRTVPAIHSDRSACIRIDHLEGWSIAYSGDTRPNPKFARLGKEVTCLIHEATFENDKLDEAVKKKHSTFSEAIQISRDMQARTTILTHFSQRYPKIPVSKDLIDLDLEAACIGLANDFMRVKLKDVWKLGHYIKPQIELDQKLEKLNIKDEDHDQEQIVLDE